mmetsp:Transcript_9758/g.22789  ORF Transcript_9758/g.22789 Transcript_9758/m.22789 type:complete len:203 (+) Transcript_9758:640-1248(+)
MYRMLPVFPVILYAPLTFPTPLLTLHSPKSPTLMCPSSLRRRFAGLRSRWMTMGEQLCRKQIARASSTDHRATSLRGGTQGFPATLRFLMRKSSRFPPRMCSLRINKGSPIVHAPRNMTRFGCRNLLRTEISLMRSARCTSLLMWEFLLSLLSILATASRPRQSACMITPPSPSPNFSPRVISERASSHCSARERTCRGCSL